MKWILLGLCVCALVLCIYNLFENIKTYNEYKVFNENVKNWSISLNDEMKFALNQAAMSILRDMDQKINDLNNNDNNLEENEESSSRED